MPRDFEFSANEGKFLLQALQCNIRLDGRAFDAFREPQVSFGKTWGSAHVQFGRTRISACISADVVQPQPDRQHEGTFAIVVELSPMASSAFEHGRQNGLETMLAHVLERALRRSSALDTESLCIIAGRQCWSLRADVHVLNFDGGLVDASCLAVIAALRHFRKPEARADGDDVAIYSYSDRAPLSLSLLHSPFCVTISFFCGGEKLLVDTSAQEQQISEGEMILTTNAQGELCQIAKLGGVSVDALLLLRCLELAVRKAQSMNKILTLALQRDEKSRHSNSVLAELQAENKR